MCEYLKAKIELYRTHLEKLWVAFIANSGGIGTLLFKGKNTTLLLFAFFVDFILVLTIFALHRKVEKLILKLKICEEEE